MAHLFGDERSANLHADDAMYQADTPEELLLKTTGWSLPVSHLRYWVQAEPVPDVPYEWQGSQLQQAGWKIEYQPSRDQVKKIKLQHPDVRLTLAIKSWQYY